MERKEKLEKVIALAKEFGLTYTDVMNYWQSQGKLFPGWAQNKTARTSQYQTPAKVTPGMFVYADGLIYPEIIKGRQIKAIVGSIDSPEVLAVCLQRGCLPWSSDWLEAKAIQTMTKGQEATRKILEISRKKRQEAEAAQWCYDYAEDGVKQGEAFLPSLAELEKLFANKAAINASLKALGVALLEGWYWSSTEYSSSYAWSLFMGSGLKYNYGKGNNLFYVRPVIKL